MIYASRKRVETRAQACDTCDTMDDTTDITQDATTRTIACDICRAVYTPSQAHRQLVMAPHNVLESAFMGMCHFCFRCCRAACPECWDAVHSVCASCVREAELPFREQVQPLVNDALSLPRLEGLEPVKPATPTLICIQHGRFSRQPSLSARASRTSRAVQVKSGRQERLGPARVQMAQGASLSADAINRSLPQVPTFILSPLYIRLNDATREPLSPFRRVLRTVEWVLNVVLLMVLLAIAVAVIAAERSQVANAQIMYLLHVDIRTEIAYLVHLAEQLHW